MNSLSNVDQSFADETKRIRPRLPTAPPPSTPTSCFNGKFVPQDKSGDSDTVGESKSMQPARSLGVVRNYVNEEDDILDDPGIKRIASFARTRRSLSLVVLRIALKIILWVVGIAAVSGLAWAIYRGISVEEFRTLLRDSLNV